MLAHGHPGAVASGRERPPISLRMNAAPRKGGWRRATRRARWA